MLPVCIFSLFLFLFLYFYQFYQSGILTSLFLKTETRLELQPEEYAKKMSEAKNGILVCITKEQATLSQNTILAQIPLELFVSDALASSMDASSEMEALKAQAIVLRTNLIKRFYQQQKNGAHSSETKRRIIWVSQQEYPNRKWEGFQKKWKKSDERYRTRIYQAVYDTQGVIMTKKEMPVLAPFHQMSAGVTREKPVGLEEEFSCVKSVSCNEVLFAEDFCCCKYFPDSVFPKPDKVQRDETGYLTQVSLGNRRMSGEQYRRMLEMPSANLTWEKYAKGYMVTSKGIGHGFGFDIFYGNILAKKGKNAFEILDYFFDSITYFKI